MTPKQEEGIPLLKIESRTVFRESSCFFELLFSHFWDKQIDRRLGMCNWGKKVLFEVRVGLKHICITDSCLKFNLEMCCLQYCVIEQRLHHLRSVWEVMWSSGSGVWPQIKSANFTSSYMSLYIILYIFSHFSPFESTRCRDSCHLTGEPVLISELMTFLV